MTIQVSLSPWWGNNCLGVPIWPEQTERELHLSLICRFTTQDLTVPGDTSVRFVVTYLETKTKETESFSMILLQLCVNIFC